MNKEINETQKKEIEELLNLPESEIMARSLGENEKWSDNYQMILAIRQNKEIIKLKESTNTGSWIIGIMTFIILILTAVLVWKAYQ